MTNILKSMNKSYLNFLMTGLIILSSYATMSQSNAGQQAKKGAGKGALIGAIAGAVFGGGDFVADVEGAAVGAGVGALAGALDGKSMDKQQQKEFDEMVRAFGEDNLRGYVELMNCNHSKAIALFKVEQESNNRDHRLTGLWLEGVAEKDRRDKEKANELLGSIVEADDDINDLQMASIAVDQYVIDLRNDRKAENISCK